MPRGDLVRRAELEAEGVRAPRADPARPRSRRARRPDDDVAGGVQTCATACAQVSVVDRDVSARRGARCRAPRRARDRRRSRRGPRAQRQLPARSSSPSREARCDDARCHPAGRASTLRRRAKSLPALASRSRHGARPSARIEERERPRARVDQRDLHVPGLRRSRRTRTRSRPRRARSATRQVDQRQDRVAVEHVLVVDRHVVRPARARAGGDQRCARRARRGARCGPASAHLDALASREARAAVQALDAVALESCCLEVALVARAHGLARRRIRLGDARLGRDTGDVDARPRCARRPSRSRRSRAASCSGSCRAARTRRPPDGSRSTISTRLPPWRPDRALVAGVGPAARARTGVDLAPARRELTGTPSPNSERASRCKASSSSTSSG